MMVEHAIALARQSVPVFPCRPDKRPYTAHGFHDASTNPAQVEAMFRQFPDATIGMPTGEASGVFVLDIDRRNGVDGFATLQGMGWSLPPAPTVQTPSGGMHVYFAHSPGLRNTAGKLGPGLDTRGDGGYVIVPPSPGYVWRTQDFRTHGLPRWGGGMALPDLQQMGQAVLDRACADIASAVTGTRNHTLNREAFLLAKHVASGQLDEDAVRARLIKAATDAGLGTAEIKRTLDSAFKGSRVEQVVVVPMTTEFSAAQLAGMPVPPREFLDEKGFIPRLGVTLFGGDGGTGKSLLATQLAASTALGRPWIGLNVRRGPVYYFACEDPQPELHIRLAEIAAAYGANLAQMADLHIAPMAGQNCVLATNDKGTIRPTPLFYSVAGRIAELRPILVIIDNLVDVFAGNNIDPSQAKQFMHLLTNLSNQNGCPILLLAHPSLTGMNNGSGQGGTLHWSNSARSRLYLTRVFADGGDKPVEDDPNMRVLTRMKANYAPTGEAIRVRWQDGVFVNEGAILKGQPGSAEADAEAVFLNLLHWHGQKRITVSAFHSNAYAPTVFAKLERGRQIGKARLEKAMHALLDRGAIQVVEHGPASKIRRHLAIVEGGA
jgi:RecA-family ATPase